MHAKKIEAAKITCEVDKGIAAQVEGVLATLGVEQAQVHSRRAVVLRERSAMPFLPPATGLDEDPVEVFEFHVPRALAHDVLLAVVRELRLFTPGRGAVYAEQVDLFGPLQAELPSEAARGVADNERPGERVAPLVLINCVVQRGHGNAIARCALELGTHVPTVNFGIGTGVRDRIGLLRIAIPAEKEVVSLLVEPQEEDETLDALVDAGRLDQPGRGFVGAYPVAFGVGNPRFFRGQQRYRATMEQVISTIDELKAGAEWRARSSTGQPTPRARRRGLTGLLNVALVCNEGSSPSLVATVMGVGAGGATISKTKHFSPTGRPLAASPAREVIDFGIEAEKLEPLLRALRDRGAFGATAACLAETKPLPKAFTYLAA